MVHRTHGKGGDDVKMYCALCNEAIEEIHLELGEVRELDGEHWHAECFAEYFEETLEEV